MGSEITRKQSSESSIIALTPNTEPTQYWQNFKHCLQKQGKTNIKYQRSWPHVEQPSSLVGGKISPPFQMCVHKMARRCQWGKCESVGEVLAIVTVDIVTEIETRITKNQGCVMPTLFSWKKIEEHETFWFTYNEFIWGELCLWSKVSVGYYFSKKLII